MMDNAPTTGDLRLNCRPGKDGDRLVFEYSLQNAGPADIFVMDAFSSTDRASRAATADAKTACVILNDQGDAIIGKFVPPLPTSQRMAVPIVPLAHRLAPEQTIERRLEIKEPLAEASPYLADLSLREYEIVDVGGVVFVISYWIAGTDGVTLAPTPYAPGLFSALSTRPGGGAALVSRRFPTRGLRVFKRTDQFPRSISL